MDKADQNSVREARQTFDPSGAAGGTLSAANKPLRAKVFKSGNSLALRLPKALGLEAGLQMELVPNGRGDYTLRRADAPKRKFNLAKVWGSATSLRPIDEDDRWFDERPLDWSRPPGAAE